jgi:hypothetical protein
METRTRPSIEARRAHMHPLRLPGKHGPPRRRLRRTTERRSVGDALPVLPRTRGRPTKPPTLTRCDMTLTSTIGGYDSTPIDVVGDSGNYPRPVLREKHSRNNPEAACAHCGGPIERRKGCAGRPRKFCAVCVPSGSPAERAAAWRQVSQEHIERYMRERWERERVGRWERAEAARLAGLAELRAWNQRVNPS